jgi:hypothetical protein
MFAVGLFLLFCLPHASASTWSPAWEQDIGPGYITTSPVSDGEHVYVRTSGFWTGEERPEVKAFTRDGVEKWSHVSPTTVQHDMSPLLLVEAGSGACGQWPELLLVGWANGDFTALHPSNGTLAWQVNSTVKAWGITGSSMIDADHVVVPTRDGLMQICLADGRVNFEVQLSNGWRNGVAKQGETYWVGSETGSLWGVHSNGTVTSSVNLSGSLRHAPLVVDHRLLLHVQEATSSSLYVYNTTAATLDLVATLGGAPAVPVQLDQTFVFGDSQGLTSVRCEPQCQVVDSLPTRVNGEMALVSGNQVFAPVNTPEGGWQTARLNATGGFVNTGQFSTPYDGYGTSAPEESSTMLYLGNDAGVLMAFERDDVVVAQEIEDGGVEAMALLGVASITLALTGSAMMAKRSRMNEAWGLLSLSALVVALLMLPDASNAWNDVLTETPSTPPDEEWDPSWPEDWLDTQVVVFELPEGTVTVGGLESHTTVWSLTQEAASQSELTLLTEDTTIGLYLTSINGTGASGWEYTINGERGNYAIDVAAIESTLVLRWSLA